MSTTLAAQGADAPTVDFAEGHQILGRAPRRWLKMGAEEFMRHSDDGS